MHSIRCGIGSPPPPILDGQGAKPLDTPTTAPRLSARLWRAEIMSGGGGSAGGGVRVAMVDGRRAIL